MSCSAQELLAQSGTGTKEGTCTRQNSAYDQLPYLTRQAVKRGHVVGVCKVCVCVSLEGSMFTDAGSEIGLCMQRCVVCHHQGLYLLS